MFRNLSVSVFRANKIFKRQCCAAIHCPTGPTDPSVAITLLTNGMRIATQETNSPMACVTLCVAAGSRYETSCNNGLTHMIEHLVYKGFRTMNQSTFEQSMFYLGAKLTAKTEREMQYFSVTLPSCDAVHAIDVFYNLVTDLNITDCAISQAKYNMSLQLQDIDRDPKAVVFDYLHETAYQGTPLAQRVIGPSNNIERFDASTANAFMCEHYQPYRFTIATSGAVSHDKMVLYSQERFGCLCSQPSDEPDPGPCRFSGSQVMYRDDSMPLAYVAVAVEAPGYSSPDYLPMLVASHLCGQWDRSQPAGNVQAALIAHAVSHDSLCEKYKSFYIAYRDTGLWGIYYVGSKMHLDDVWHVIQNQFMNLCITTTKNDVERGVNQTKLTIAKKRFLGAVKSSHDIGRQVMYTCGRESYELVCTELSKLRANKLRGVAEKYLYDRCPAVAAMGPVECLPEYNRIRSGMYWLRL